MRWRSQSRIILTAFSISLLSLQSTAGEPGICSLLLNSSLTSLDSISSGELDENSILLAYERIMDLGILNFPEVLDAQLLREMQRRGALDFVAFFALPRSPGNDSGRARPINEGLQALLKNSNANRFETSLRPLLNDILDAKASGKEVNQGSLIRARTVLREASPRRSVVMDHQAPIQSVAFSVDGRLIYAGTSQAASTRYWGRLWVHTVQGSWVSHHDIVEYHPVYSISVAPDTGNLVLGVGSNRNGKIEVRDPQGNFLFKFPNAQLTLLSSVFTSDGAHLIGGAVGQVLRIWDPSGQVVTSLPTAGARYNGLALSHQDSLLAAGGSGLEIWDLPNRHLIASPDVGGATIHGVAFSQDGQRLLSSSSEYKAMLWTSKGEHLADLVGHKSWVYGVAFTHDGKHLLTSDGLGNVGVWDSAGSLISLRKLHRDAIEAMALSPDGTLLLTGSKDGTARITPVEDLITQ
jgi:hypothetical protein